VRYTDAEKPDFAKLAGDYRKAMGELSKKYPDDLDAANFYAESMMLLHPWKLWHVDGSPEENTLELVAVLESVMRREPNHIGANHLYIHAVEASANPERALPSADRLAGLATGAGHIVHMPAHIYMRCGDFEAAATSNEAAIAADKEYFKDRPVQGIYPAMYYSHNVHFLAIADGMRGCSAESRKAADALVAHVGPSVKAMPMLEGFMTIPMFVKVRFRQWDDILGTPQPDASMHVTTALWHFGRAMADVNKGKIDDAAAEQKKFDEIRGAVPADAVFSPWNKAGDVLDIADRVLIAQFARAKDNRDGEIAALRDAVEKQDGLNYGEPLDWPWPLRESLGAALLRSGDAAGAEKVFREDLEKNPRNGRSLFGLIESLKAQKKTADMEMLQRQYDEAWKKADVKLAIETM
jgi:tetratricopeptide (TPR) repeat protein